MTVRHCCVLQVETREDEEQNVKLQETIELLLAAGYFRARIKGLSPFDKVIFHRSTLFSFAKARFFFLGFLDSTNRLLVVLVAVITNV